MLSCAPATTQTLNGTSPPREAHSRSVETIDRARPRANSSSRPCATFTTSAVDRWAGRKRTIRTTIGYIDDQPSLSRRRRFALLAGLGVADDLTGRRDENWLTGMGTAITGTASDRRRADTVALTCAFRIPAEGFAVAGFVADLIGAPTDFFAADRVGAIVFFF